MVNIDKLVRFLLSIILIFLGLNHFFNFLPTTLLTDEAIVFFQALKQTGYVLHIYAANQLIAASLFLINRYVTLGTLLILPGSINFLMFNLLLDSTGLLMSIILVVLLSALIYKRKENYTFMFKK